MLDEEQENYCLMCAREVAQVTRQQVSAVEVECHSATSLILDPSGVEPSSVDKNKEEQRQAAQEQNLKDSVAES
jgi:hypothetical protein